MSNFSIYTAWSAGEFDKRMTRLAKAEIIKIVKSMLKADIPVDKVSLSIAMGCMTTRMNKMLKALGIKNISDLVELGWVEDDEERTRERQKQFWKRVNKITQL